MFQTLELFDTALDMWAMRFVFFVKVAELRLEFAAQSTKTARPSIVSADHRGIHQQFFPTDRNGERGFLDDVGLVYVQAGRLRWKISKDLIVRWCPLQRLLDRRSILIHWRHLSQR